MEQYIDIFSTTYECDYLKMTCTLHLVIVLSYISCRLCVFIVYSCKKDYARNAPTHIADFKREFAHLKCSF